MPASELRLLPEAQADVADGEIYYRERSPQAADGFLVALDHAFELIAAAPNRWPRYRRGTRRFVLQTYPYSVIYKAVFSRSHIRPAGSPVNASTWPCGFAA